MISPGEAEFMNPSVTPAAVIAASMLSMSVFSGPRSFTATGPMHDARRNSCTPVIRLIFSRKAG